MYAFYSFQTLLTLNCNSVVTTVTNFVIIWLAREHGRQIYLSFGCTLVN